MSDAGVHPDRDRPHASRARRRDAALVAEYVHELSERHGGAPSDGSEHEPANEGPRRDE